MAQSFTPAEWKKINEYTDKHGAAYGLPAKRSHSLVVGSFNIRKLGEVKSKSQGAWEYLGRICERFDLIAIQEVMDNLEGLKHLHQLLGSGYGVVCSDTTGSYPGEQSMAERLAFLFRWKNVQRTEIASDITYDRTKVSNELFKSRTLFWDAFKAHAKELEEIETENAARKKAGKSAKAKPAVPNPEFLTFIRQPLCVSFELRKPKTQTPIQFLAINCHLLYGTDPAERQREFDALVSWVLERAKQHERMAYPNMLVMGDCNLEFRDPAKERPKIDTLLKSLNKSHLNNTKDAKLNLPFLDVHPQQEQVFRTAARLKDTYDQVMLVIRDARLPDYTQNAKAGTAKDGFDYGVFNFVQLFSQALYNKPLDALDKKTQTAFFAKFTFDLTDHMPIWIRLAMEETYNSK